MQIEFRKMHGAGNDFVVIDRRSQPPLPADLAVRLADRRLGIGCDQLVVLEDSAQADIFMRLYNHDGGEIGACGNASRCVARLLMDESGRHEVRIETRAGVLPAHKADDGYSVVMGQPRWEWREIPLSESRNTLHLGLQEGALMDPAAISIGNPHMLFFVRDIEMIDLAKSGPVLEHHPLFPQRVNVSAVQVVSPDHLRMKTWERGAGLTLACGSAACAAVVAGVRRDLCQRAARVDVPGGSLFIEWKAAVDAKDNGLVHMTGPAETVFFGRIEI